jgi:hypothetical protein
MMARSTCRGLKIRGGASYDAMYSALGISRVDVPAGDIYTALERGLVEGIGFTTIGVSSAGMAGLPEVPHLPDLAAGQHHHRRQRRQDRQPDRRTARLSHGDDRKARDAGL